MTYNKDNSVLASGGFDSNIFLWDCKSYNKAPIQVLKHCKDSVTNIKFVDKTIYVSSVDGKVRMFDIRYGEVKTDNLF